MRELKGDLILCTTTYDDTKDFKSFGASIKKECNIDLNQYTKDNKKMYFYELYLKNGNENEYYDVPVYISNINIKEIQNNLYKEDNEINRKQRQYVRRFFIFNNLLNDRRIIYAYKITFRTRLQNLNDESRIYQPFLEIEYDEGDLNTNTEINYKGHKVSFRTDYYMDIEKRIMKGVIATFVIVTVASFIFTITRMYIWTKLNPSPLSPDNYLTWALGTGLMKLFKYWGLFMFFWVWGLTAYFYIFFKIQYRPYIMFPTIDVKYRKYYYRFCVIWGLACASYQIYMFYRIYQQIDYDIFFVDWEHDKDLLINNLNDIRSQKYRGAWRGLHIANQFNILQKQRTISIPFCFCWLIMLWYYHKTKWANYAHRVPNVNFVENSPESKILRHFIGTFVLFISGITQYYLRRILQFQFPMKKMEFLDLCSVANISVFILEDSLHGYYIHGQSPLGKADTNLAELVKFLEEEGKGKIRGRGLTEDENDDLQSYEIYLSYNMRCIYDHLYYMQTQSEITLADNADKLHNQSRLPNFFKYVPNSLNIQNIYVLSNYMNNQLKAKIEQVASQSKIFIREKTKIERFLEFPPSIDLTGNDAKELVFYKDPGVNFDNVLFMGMEIEWLISVIYWWQMWTITLERYGGGAQSFALSIFLTYVCEKILFKIRIFFGEKNVAKKAVIDNRFL